MSLINASLTRSRRLHVVALMVAVAYVVLAVWVSGGHGPTWDCATGDYAYGEATWTAVLHGEDPVAVYQGEVVLTHPHRQPHPEFESHFLWFQMFPLASTLSAASCDLLWSWLGWVPPMAAHHFVIGVFVALLLYAIVVFLGSRVSLWAGVLAAAMLVTSPRFFANDQNNSKDVPEACVYSLCALAFYRASANRNLRWWCAVGVLAGLALAQKQNALFLPIQFAITAILFVALIPSEHDWKERGLLRGVLAGLAVFVPTYVISSPWLWYDLTRAVDHWNEWFVVGGIGNGGVSWEGAYGVLVTTPIPLLVAGIVGILAREVDSRLKVFLVSWLLFTVGRLLLPGMRNFDGVRHFLEFYPPLVMLGALGVRDLAGRVPRAWAPPRAMATCLGVCILLPGAWATVSTHPNGVCYFNALVGGLPGAIRKRIPEAWDYWGNSFWQGLAWLDRHGPSGTRILSPIAPQIVRCGAYRLRGDMEALHDGAELSVPLAVIYTTHSGNDDPLIHQLEANHVPAASIVVQGTPILRIHVFADPGEVAALGRLWKREKRAKSAIARVAAWAGAQVPSLIPQVVKISNEIALHGLEESTRRLQAILPDLLHQDAEDLLWWKWQTVPNADDPQRPR